MQSRPLSLLLKKVPKKSDSTYDKELKDLQFRILRIQQGIWHQQRRAVIVFEGFDAAGKGGTIRRLVEMLDPRGIRVYATGPPTPEEKARHYLARFWSALPTPGMISIFDRSWYGRVLVERVEKLTPKHRWKDAFSEIRHFEKMLTNDDIDLIKIFLSIHPEEQLRRFEERLRNPSKQWKLTDDDLRAHEKWPEYVTAADEALKMTSTKNAPWNLIPADVKPTTHYQVLKLVVEALGHHENRIQEKAEAQKRELEIRTALEKLKHARRKWSHDNR